MEVINSHHPLYVESWDWTGMNIGEKWGIWYHPVGNATFSYSGGFLNGFSAGAQSWLDTANQTTDSVVGTCE